MLGKFEIMVDGDVVLLQLNQLRKTRLFLEYLILKKDRDVTQAEIIGVLWADGESTNPATALRTMLHRFRALIEKSGLPELRDIIVAHRGVYRFNPNLNCVIDVFELEELAAGIAGNELANNQKLESCYRVLELYKGLLLPDSGAEPWVQPKSAHCHTQYLNSVYTMIELLKALEKHEAVVDVCRRAIEVDNYDERLNVELVESLIKTGKNRDAFSQFQKSEAAYMRRGTKPTDEFREMYSQIIANEQKIGADIEDVVIDLTAGEPERGAFVCSYEVFKDMYHIECRLLERNNIPMFISLLTIESMGEGSDEALRTENAMNALLEIVKGNLRRGDIVARYSAKQYVILLANVTTETCEMVMERVKTAFYEKHRRLDVKLGYRVRQVGAKRLANGISGISATM